jgi:hypothetical protein
LVGPTTTAVDLRKVPETSRALESSTSTTALGIRRSSPATRVEPDVVPDDLVIRGIIELRSHDARRVRRVLRAGPPTADLVPHVIELLRREELAADAQRALQLVAVRHEGQLVDALRDAEESPSVRCGVARVLAKAGAPSAARGLLEGLSDARFAVRCECGAALARLRARHPEMKIDQEQVHAAVEREARVDRRVWERTQAVEPAEAADSPFYEDVLKERMSLSLQHVFTLLSLVYPERNLRVAYKALHTDDETLRGNALEYLESILPRSLRDCLWPFLDDHRAGAGYADADSALDSLLQSHPSILENLESLRRRAERERR